MITSSPVSSRTAQFLSRIHSGQLLPAPLSLSRLCLLFSLAIPLKSGLAVEMLEKGKVRFWLQAEQISPNAKVDYVFNDNVVSQGEVGGLDGRQILLLCNVSLLNASVTPFLSEI